MCGAGQTLAASPTSASTCSPWRWTKAGPMPLIVAGAALARPPPDGRALGFAARGGTRHLQSASRRGLERAQARALGDAEADPVTIGSRRIDHGGLVIADILQAPHVAEHVVGFDGVALDEVDQPSQVGAAGQQDCARWVAVPPRATYLLVVGLHALGNRPMNHRAHVGLVDAHP